LANYGAGHRLQTIRELRFAKDIAPYPDSKMKVQIVRLVVASCMTFLVVYCFVYFVIGRSNADHSPQPLVSKPIVGNLTDAVGEGERADALVRDSEITPVKVTPSAEPETGEQPQLKTASDTSFARFQIDASWFQGSQEDRGRFARLLRAEQAPQLSVEQWTNTRPISPQAREGKIVVISFWSTWCQPCLSSIGFNNKLFGHYQDQDVTFIGVCASQGSEDMAKIIKSKGIQYPVCSDLSNNESILAYKVQAIPSYFVIDREGRLRFADVKRDRVDDAIEYLLSRD
jgi:peroxiredoxin